MTTDLIPAVLALDTDETPEPYPDHLLDQPDAELEPIANQEIAEYALRRIATIEDHVRRVRAQASMWRSRIDAWLTDETTAPAARVDRLNRMLVAWGIEQRNANPRGTATFRLPSGEIATKRGKEPTVELDDEEAFLAWAVEELDAARYEAVTRTTTKALISEVRKVVVIRTDTDDGETFVTIDDMVVPGLRVDQPVTTAVVRPSPASTIPV